MHLLATRARRHPARAALTVLAPGGEVSCRLDYGTLESAVAAAATAIAREIRPGDRVLLLCENTAAFAVAFLGCLRAGGIAVPAPRWAHRERMAGIMADCRPALVLVEHDEATDGRWDPLELSESIEGLVWRTLPPIPIGTPPAAEDAVAEHAWPTPDMPAVLQYTSGSTSEPRGVVVSHANIMANARILTEAMGVNEQTVVVSWLPVFHDMGLFGGLLQPILCGGHTVLMPRLTMLRNPLSWLRAISDHRATISGAPNFAYEACVEALTRREAPALDLSSWRLAYNGSEPVQARTLARFARAFAPYGFRSEASYPTYGMAEATLFLTGSRLGRLPVVRRFDSAITGAATGALGTVDLVSSGRPVPGTTLRIVDPASHRVLPDGSVGEVWAAGPQVSDRYWQDAPASAALRVVLPEQPGIPFLRTGDLGFLDDGELFVTGRRDDVITWHGRNIYPQDLERVACDAHPAVEPGCVAAFALDGLPTRVALVVGLRKGRSTGDFPAVVQAVREAVWQAADVVPQTVALVRRAEIARTSSGKIRRDATRRALVDGNLPVLHLDRADPGILATKRDAAPGAGPDAAPGDKAREHGRTDLLAALAHLPDRPGPVVLDPDLPLFAQGFDSLSLLTLAGRIEDRFGIAPSTGLLFAATAGTIGDWLAELPLPPDRGSPGSRRSEARRLTRLPLSREQLAVYFAEASAGASIALLPLVLPAVGAQRLATAVAGLLHRHPMLNARIASGPGGVAFDLAAPEDTSPDNLIERLPDVEGEDIGSLEHRLWRAARAPIDMRRRAPLRLIVGPTVGAGQPAVLAVHHLVCDARSLARIADDVSADFAGAAPDGALSPPVDVVAGEEARLSSAARERDLRAWTEDLTGVPPSVSPPWPAPDAAADDDSSEMPARRFLLEAALVDAVRKTGAALGVSTATVLLSAWGVALSRLGVSSPAAVTITASARESLRDEAGIGYAVRPVPIRMGAPEDGASLRGLILAAHARVVGALDREAAPFPLVVHALQTPRGDRYAPFMQFQFGHVRLRHPIAVDARGACAALAGENAAPGPHGFLLPQMEAIAQANLQIYETDRDVAAMLVYDPLTVRADTAESLERAFRLVVVAMGGDIDSPAGAIDLVTPAGLAAAPPWQVPFLPVHALARRESALDPSRCAVIEPAGRTDNRTLWRRVDGLAGLLPGRGSGPGSIVATILPRSADLVAAQLAILQAGHAFLPIDSTAPTGRIGEILDDARPAIVLVTADTARHVPAGCTTLTIESADARHDPAAAAPSPTVAADDPAFVIYTSGSTGRPKGVVCSHGALASRIADLTARMAVEPDSRVLAYVSPAFDPAVQEVFMAVTRGAVLVTAPQADGFDPREIATIMAREAVTHAVAVPSMLREIVTQPEFAGCRSLQCVSCGGERLTAELRDRLVSLSGARLLNVYGATETTICSTVWDTTDQPDRLVAAVGHAMADTVVRIVDDAIRELPVGVIGEIGLGGPAIGTGYLNRPVETAARFVADPVIGGDARLYRTGDTGWLDSSGLLWFVGRLDDQVKISGYRIEPEEVAARVRNLPGVEDATVLAVSTSDGKAMELIAYVCPRSGQRPTIRSLAAGLAETLPAPLCPAAYVVLDRMPLTVNGKIDRSALRPATEVDRIGADHGAASPQSPVGGDPLIEAIAKLVGEVLGVAHIDPEADFFTIGGHSLLALELVHRLESELGHRVPATALYSHATIKALAALVRSSEDRDLTPGADPADQMPLCRTLRPGGRREPLFLVAPGLRGVAAFDRLAPRLAPDRPVFCLSPPGTGSRAGAAAGQNGADPAIAGMDDLVQTYAETVLRVAGNRAVHVVGYSVGGIAAFETARTVVTRGGTVASLTLVDTLGPRWTRVGLAAVTAMKRFPALVAGMRRFTRGGRFADFADDAPLLNHLRLAAGYRPGAWPGVLNFVGRSAGAWTLGLLIDQWATHSASLNRSVVPGGHSSMFLDPAVKSLAETLDGIMSASEASTLEQDQPIPGDPR